MSKTLYLVRHGEGEHNINNDFNLRDPCLTPHGEDQCRGLRESFPFHDDVQIIMASPLCRTIQTAIEGFAPALQRANVPLLLVPQAQEISSKPCDVGFNREELQSRLRGLPVINNAESKFDIGKIDYSLLDDGWNSKQGVYEASLKAVEQRASELRRWLWQRKETFIVLVTHGAFLHYLTEDWSCFTAAQGTAYKNCEFRSFTFTKSSNAQNAHLKEIGGNGWAVCKPVGAHASDITGVAIDIALK